MDPCQGSERLTSSTASYSVYTDQESSVKVNKNYN